MIIDAHAHIDIDQGAPFNESPEKNLSYILAEMNEVGIDHVILLARFFDSKRKKDPHYQTTPEIIRIVAGNPQVSVVGTIDPTEYVAEDLAALEQLIKEKKIVGIKLYLGYQSFYANEERCFPIYALAERYNIPIIFHTGDTWGSHHLVKYSQPLPIDEVAVAFPNLKIIIAHMGNPWMIDCAELLYKNKNVYADISGLVADRGSFDSPYGKLVIQRTRDLIAYAGADKLLFGTDWPLATLASYRYFVEQLGLSAEQLELILHKNAEALFHLK